MSKKNKDWRETKSSFQIHTKDGREKFLNEVLSTWEGMYPAKADFFRRSLKELRAVTKESYSLGVQKGDASVRFRVPTELWLFIKRWIPEFGKDSEDVELLCRVACDLVRPTKDHRRRTRLFTHRGWKPNVRQSCS
jgi:hypothetical protein